MISLVGHSQSVLYVMYIILILESLCTLEFKARSNEGES